MDPRFFKGINWYTNQNSFAPFLELSNEQYVQEVENWTTTKKFSRLLTADIASVSDFSKFRRNPFDFVVTGECVNNVNQQKKKKNDKKDIEWLGLRTPGLYRCMFNDITTNETGIIILYDSVKSAIIQQSNSYDATKIKPPMNIESQPFSI
ncbi:MAG: hypothetical protein EZS28_011439 [Streblomastix strix]|uniref:Uncharacterized protein n=1 Tax=Streblomastix strix TaxID=222440 RepID=A0A5J4WEC0_9EUKA|nr:MAG: hypothetical protein EZS28_011439 [Streblomastix strix]